MRKGGWVNKGKRPKKKLSKGDSKGRQVGRGDNGTKADIHKKKGQRQRIEARTLISPTRIRARGPAGTKAVRGLRAKVRRGTETREWV